MFNLLLVGVVLTAPAAMAGLREEVANQKYYCSDSIDGVYLKFGASATSATRRWGDDDAERVRVIWQGDRATIGGASDQDGPFYLEKRGGRLSYAGKACAPRD